jgi:uncharacterized membrane protein YbhN (UPF0104 family)
LTPPDEIPSTRDAATSPGRLGRRVLLSVLLGAAVYLAFSLYADLGAVRRALAGFPASGFLGICALAFLNYLLRFLKWERYRKTLGVSLSRGASFRIYLAGFALSVTPGKMGELVKSVLLKREAGVPISRTAPIVVAERFTDLLGYLVLMLLGYLAHGLLGAAPLDRGWLAAFAAAFLLLLLLLAIATSGRAEALAGSLVARAPLVGPYAPKIEAAFRSSRILLAARELPFPTAVSVVSWGCECAAFHLVARVFGAETDLGLSTFAYAFAAIFGALSMIPGGLGLTDGSLGYLLDHQMGLDRSEAAAATMIIRAGTLWFAVALGSLCLALSLRREREAPSASP